MTAIVQAGQTLPDIAIQYCGSLTVWPTLASLNGLAMTAQLTSGQVLNLPAASDKRTVAVFKSGSHAPATGSILQYGDGIGWWVIENDFIVQ